MIGTMILMPSSVAIYQAMSDLSSRMVEAARQQDWDTLIDLERQVSALRDELMATDSGITDPDEIELRRQLIAKILGDDAEVRRHTEPWMEQVRRFLGNARQRDRLERTYGAV